MAHESDNLNTLKLGIRLFNDAHFFDAHEALEDCWRVAPEEHKKFLQGLTQLAVAFHHYSTGNLVGCRSVLARALRNLSACPDGLFNLRTKELVDAFAPCLQALDENKPIPSLPKLTFHDT